MLGNATIPQQQQQQQQHAPHVQLHQQPQFDMLGNPIEAVVAATPTPPPVEENKINGVNIVGVVNTSDNTVDEQQQQQADDKPGKSSKISGLISGLMIFKPNQ